MAGAKQGMACLACKSSLRRPGCGAGWKLVVERVLSTERETARTATGQVSGVVSGRVCVVYYITVFYLRGTKYLNSYVSEVSLSSLRRDRHLSALSR